MFLLFENYYLKKNEETGNTSGEEILENPTKYVIHFTKSKKIYFKFQKSIIKKMGGERNEVNRIKSMMHMHGDVITKFIHSYNEYVLIKKEKK